MQQDFRLPKSHFTTLSGFQPKDFDEISQFWSEDGYPVFAALEYYKDKANDYQTKFDNLEQKLLSVSSDSTVMQEKQQDIRDTEKEILDNKIREYKILEKTVAIETKLGLLVSKDAAEQRMRDTLRAVAESIAKFVDKSSEIIVSKGSLEFREIQKVQTDCYNRTVQDLYETADQITWQEDGKTEVLLQRIQQFKESDPIFLKLYEELYGKVEL